MSISEALQRISQINQMVAAPKSVNPAQVANQPSPNTPSSTSTSPTSQAAPFQKALRGADASGINPAAYRSAQPVQNGQLVQSLFQPRQQAANWIAQRFGLSVTSDYRSPQHNAQVGGAPNSYHTKGLAFDFVGSTSEMNAARDWAKRHPEIFREVLVHDVGSGMHLHLAFRSS